MDDLERKDDFLFYGLSMIGSEIGRERYEQLAERNRARRERREQEIAERKSRESDIQRHEDEDGTIWEYVVMDGNEAHLIGCETREEELNVPSQISGLPVTYMREGSCTRLDSVRKIIISQNIKGIDDRTFQFNEKLNEVIFPDDMERFSSRMFQGCNRVRSLKLPGAIRDIDSDVFSLPDLESLIIGSGTESIISGAFSKSRLKSIEISNENPYIATDGIGIYDRHFTKLLAIACPVASYEVEKTCTIIGRLAFSQMECIESITLADSTEVIEDQGLAKTGITSFQAPTNLREIGRRAFFNCEHLSEISLNQGLRRIGSEAFKGAGILRIEIPASVQEIETPLLDTDDLAKNGNDYPIIIASDSPYYLLDDYGGLYRKTHEGLVFQHLFNDSLTSYTMLEGTVEIGCHSLSQHKIARVDLPDSVRVINDCSFKGCSNLTTLKIPEHLEEIGVDAFLDTSLSSLRIPSSLTRIGDCALISMGAHNGRSKPSLTEIIVEEGNPRFFKQNGLLLEKKDDSTLKLVLYVGPDNDVYIPSEVSEIAPYAFNGVTTIQELFLTDNIKTVGTRGLAIKENLRKLHIDLTNPIEGHEFFDIDLPQTDRCFLQINNILGLAKPIELETLFETYDAILLNASSLANERSQGINLYEQTIRIIERLKDPIFMSTTSKKFLGSFIERHLNDICIAFTRHNDRLSFDDLMNLGYLSRENINEIITSLSALQDASITGYLLEAKRQRFKDFAIDFEI